MRSLGLYLCLMCVAACAPASYDHRQSVLHAVPTRWQSANEWTFHVTDNTGRPLGHILLYLTLRPLESEKCTVPGWYRADVIENALEFALDGELAPGYLINGPWITVDLAATSCNLGYKMIGTLTSEGAAGHFNVVHSLGGEHVGSFTALPVVVED